MTPLTDIERIYARKSKEMRTNFEWAIKLQCGLQHPIFKSVIKDTIFLDTPVESLEPLKRKSLELYNQFKKNESIKRVNQSPKQ